MTLSRRCCWRRFFSPGKGTPCSECRPWPGPSAWLVSDQTKRALPSTSSRYLTSPSYYHLYAYIPPNINLQPTRLTWVLGVALRRNCMLRTYDILYEMQRYATICGDMQQCAARGP
eukprot:8119292-Pyramimonas_sp.AAC.2